MAERRGPERKTGLYVPNVETVRLVSDERGWIRLAVRVDNDPAATGV